MNPARGAVCGKGGGCWPRDEQQRSRGVKPGMGRLHLRFRGGDFRGRRLRRYLKTQNAEVTEGVTSGRNQMGSHG